MIGELLPPSVVAVETREDSPGVVLFPDEEALIAKAVPKRRSEFATARQCAREALAELGLPPVAILSGPKREPRWPSGVVGSITHCDGYRAAVVARTRDLRAVGIDAEPHAALPDGVLETVSLDEERRSLRQLSADAPEVHWDRLLFSIKESVYKVWYPLVGSWLGFSDALVTLDALHGTFSASLLVEGPVVDGREHTRFNGRWAVREGLILTALALPRRSAPERQDVPRAAETLSLHGRQARLD